jgi:hypothetical protein
VWAHNLPDHVQDSLQEGRTLSDSDNTEEVIADYARSLGKKPKLDPASEEWLAAQMAGSSPEESRFWEELTYGKEWAKQNPASDKIRAALDKQKQERYAQRERDDIDYAKRLEELQAGRTLSETDVMDMLLEEGRTMEEAMRFLADQGMTWEDMTESMLENFLAEGSS